LSRYQKGKTTLDFTGARDSEWQWYQLGHMQICTSPQTDNHASTQPIVFYRPDALHTEKSCMQVHNYKPSPIQRYQNHFHIPTSSWEIMHNVIQSVTNKHLNKKPSVLVALAR